MVRWWYCIVVATTTANAEWKSNGTICGFGAEWNSIRHGRLDEEWNIENEREKREVD